jgi:dTDP-4-dehydrorhamnose 3,5-epimerase-like enzyme
MGVQVLELVSRSDARGDSWSPQLPFEITREMHIATLRPGHVRRNHVHAVGRELMAVMYSDAWTLFWDEGEGSAVQSRRFEGSGAVQVSIDPGFAHALRNDGTRDVVIVVLGDAPRTSDRPDTAVRKISTEC